MTKFNYDMSIISALSDTPNDSDGLSAQQLKAKFDEGGIELQRFINGTLIEEIEEQIDGKGDMSKAVYDTDNDGIVDHAKLADTATRAASADNAENATNDKDGNDITTTYSKTTHTHSLSSLGAAASSHTHTASAITNSTAPATLGVKMIVLGTTNNETTIAGYLKNDGDIYLQYQN